MMRESAGLLLDRYRLVDRVGRGGMGSVWRGYDEYLRRPVAIKEIHFPDELDATERAERRRRVVREARATARLRHPGVVSVYDVIEQDDRPWIIMELVESRSLAEIIKSSGPLPARRAAQIGLRLLDALQAAHQAGVIHRDVKPGNVLVGPRGHVVLSDFGIATYDGASALTRSGTFLGSPAYLAPELAQGERATPASDLWSLGATLYAAVEGRPPYDRDTAVATLGALLTQDPDPAERAGPLRPAIEGLLRKQPDQRSSARRTRALLSRVLENHDEPSRPRYRRRQAIIGGIATLMAGSALGFITSPHSNNPPPGPAISPKSPTDNATPVPAEHVLVVHCRTNTCDVFIATSPDNEVLFNGILRQGEFRAADEPRMTLEISDAGTCDVFINGRLQPKGTPGEQQTFEVVKA